MVDRAEVYKVLDGERDYQDSRRVRDGSTSADGTHTPEEFLLYMDYYLSIAKEKASTIWGPDCRPAVLDFIRKVTALGVACMEENGVVAR